MPPPVEIREVKNIFEILFLSAVAMNTGKTVTGFTGKHVGRGRDLKQVQLTLDLSVTLESLGSSH